MFEFCCKKNTVKLDAFYEPPPELQDLLFDDSSQGKVFHEHICQYNSTLMFTFLGYKKDACPENQQSHSLFQIHSKLYHLQGLLEANSENSAQYFQLFFYDLTYAVKLCYYYN